MRESLVIFLERDILPIYDSFDSAHDIKHARSVMAASLAAAGETGADEEMCLTAAAYHDIGLRLRREDHNITSANIMRSDKRLEKWFTGEQIRVMADAVEDHRASASEPPRTLCGRILADADREYTVERILERTVLFGRSEYTELSPKEQIDRAYRHVREKYGESGYLSFCTEREEYKNTARRITALLADRERFEAMCQKYLASPDVRMEAARYLRRIGFTGQASPDAGTLRSLQVCHLRSVPYENMDILKNKPLSLERRDLYRKIVLEGRGGFCFELNELFGWLLRVIGFHVVDCFGRFLAGEASIPMRRHHVLIVTVPDTGERYLCDVGVGSGSPTEPLPLICSRVFDQGDNVWDIVRDSYLGYVVRLYKHGGWQSVYSFTEEPQLPEDFLAACFYCEHSPSSPFNKAPMISLRNERGRTTLDGDELRFFEGDTVRTEKVSDIPETLDTYFGIRLNSKP